MESVIWAYTTDILSSIACTFQLYAMNSSIGTAFQEPSNDMTTRTYHTNKQYLHGACHFSGRQLIIAVARTRKCSDSAWQSGPEVSQETSDSMASTGVQLWHETFPCYFSVLLFTPNLELPGAEGRLQCYWTCFATVSVKLSLTSRTSSAPNFWAKWVLEVLEA